MADLAPRESESGRAKMRHPARTRLGPSGNVVLVLDDDVRW